MSDDLRLTSEAGHEIANPSQEVVLDVLRGMEGRDEAFVILERAVSSGDTYIQAAPNPGGGYMVEYQDGSTDRHFGLVAEDVQAVHDIFSWWVVDQPGWRDGLPWQRIEL